jgi:hypothetical protein
VNQSGRLPDILSAPRYPFTWHYQGLEGRFVWMFCTYLPDRKRLSLHYFERVSGALSCGCTMASCSGSVPLVNICLGVWTNATPGCIPHETALSGKHPVQVAQYMSCHCLHPLIYTNTYRSRPASTSKHIRPMYPNPLR